MYVAVGLLACHHRFHHTAAAVDEQRVIKQEAEACKAVGVVSGLFVVPPATLIGVAPAAHELRKFNADSPCHTAGSFLCPFLEPTFRLEFAEVKRSIRFGVVFGVA